MKINILGTEYDYEISTETEDIGLLRGNGYCDAFKKRIIVEGEFNENDPNSVQDIEAFKKKVKRHEIVHAYLFESGLTEYAENEQLVEWVAWQFPKLLETLKEVGAI